jgi:hypothetical protein
MSADLFGRGDFYGARVGLLLRDAGLGQIVDNRLGLYFQVARELVDANLICFCHSPVDFSFRSTLSSSDALGSWADAVDSSEEASA